MTALAKVVAHWLLTGMPLILLSPIAALLLSLGGQYLVGIGLTLLLGTPVLSLYRCYWRGFNGGIAKGWRVVEFACCSVVYSCFNFASSILEAAGLNVP